MDGTMGLQCLLSVSLLTSRQGRVNCRYKQGNCLGCQHSKGFPLVSAFTNQAVVSPVGGLVHYLIHWGQTSAPRTLEGEGVAARPSQRQLDRRQSEGQVKHKSSSLPESLNKPIQMQNMHQVQGTPGSMAQFMGLQ